MKKPKGYDEYTDELNKREKRKRTIFCSKCKKDYKVKEYFVVPISIDGFLEMYGVVCPKMHKFEVEKEEI